MEQSGWIFSAAIMALVFVAATLGGALIAGVVLVKLPANYFCNNYRREIWPGKHPALRWAGRVLKNLCGASLVVLGAVLSVPGIPGPGLLMILFGISLLDFPGKRRLERWLVGRPVVLNTTNRLRQRYGKPPIVLESAR
jgi:hypothetical protein